METQESEREIRAHFPVGREKPVSAPENRPSGIGNIT